MAASGYFPIMKAYRELYPPGDTAVTSLLDEVRAYPGVDQLPDRSELPAGSDLLVALHIRTPVGEMRLLTTIATIGAPFDATLAELRLETLLPANSETEAILSSLANHPNAAHSERRFSSKEGDPMADRSR